MTPADSLATSAAIFRDAGRTFDADFTTTMIAPAADHPALYAHFAAQQAERAARFQQRNAA